jgi:hypothetical protein
VAYAPTFLLAFALWDRRSDRKDQSGVHGRSRWDASRKVGACAHDEQQFGGRLPTTIPVLQLQTVAMMSAIVAFLFRVRPSTVTGGLVRGTMEIASRRKNSRPPGPY